MKIFNTLIVMLLIASHQIAAKGPSDEYESAEITLTSKSGQVITLTAFEMDALRVIMQDLGRKVTEKTLFDRESYSTAEKTLKVNNAKYTYTVKEGMASIYQGKSIMSQLDLPHIFEVISNADEKTQEKCPVCFVGIGIVLSQGICSLSGGGEHQYCRNSCQCGVAAVETTCMMGFRSTSCQCQPCQEPPQPSSLYPATGGGWLSGVPWVGSPIGGIDPWVLDDEK